MEKGKVKELKEERWVAVIDNNTKEELAVVRLTTKNQPNSTILPTYKKGNKKDTYFKHFVEIEDNEGNPIKADGKKFVKNDRKYDLSSVEIKIIKNKVFHHVKQAEKNNQKIIELKDKKNPQHS